MPRLQPGFIVTEEGVKGPETTPGPAAPIVEEAAPTLEEVFPAGVDPIARREPLRGCSLEMIHVDENYPGCPPPDPEEEEAVQLAMATYGYSEEDARYLRERIRFHLAAGAMHTVAVSDAESDVYDAQMQRNREKFFIPEINRRRAERKSAREAQREFEQVEAPTSDPDEANDVPLTEAEAVVPVLVTASVAAPKRRRGEEKLLHISTAVPPELKDWLVRQGSSMQMKLGAYVREVLEQWRTRVEGENN